MLFKNVFRTFLLSFIICLFSFPIVNADNSSRIKMRNTKESIRILVVGCGNMGSSHALAYHKINAFEIVGLVNRSPQNREKLLDKLGGSIPTFDNYELALKVTNPDAVSINTYTETHAEYAIKALSQGAHVFVEKPLAQSVKQAMQVIKASKKYKRKLLVGYILRYHPTWQAFIKKSKLLGKPLVMRMNLNQQSFGSDWLVHKNLMNSTSPIVDCGVHYVDVMSQMTRSKPVMVHAIGARLTNVLKAGMYNYGQLQVEFEDGSIGWYEAGWGPMMSENAHFIKDVIGPNGSISLVPNLVVNEGGSSDIGSHTKADQLIVHRSALNNKGLLEYPDEKITFKKSPTHQDLCDKEQAYFLKTIKEDLDLSEHHQDLINSLKIVIAADQSIRDKCRVKLHHD